MFTPMNGRRIFARTRRTVEEEFISETKFNINNLFYNKESRQLFFDSIGFYLSLHQNEKTNLSMICQKRCSILDNYAGASPFWTLTMKHVLDGILELRGDPKSCIISDGYYE